MKKINKFFDIFEELLLVIIMAVMIIMNFLNVIFRYLLPQSPFSYTEEITLLLFVWATMIGIAAGLKRGSHTGMSLITDRIPPRYHKIAIVISTALMCFFACIIIYSGITLVKNNFSYGNILPALNISANWKSMAFPVGGILMLYRSICAGVSQFKEAEEVWNKRLQDKAEYAEILRREAEENARLKNERA